MDYTETLTPDFFSPWEGEIINSFQDAIKRIDEISERCSQTETVWRGQSHHAWGLHSGLYRSLNDFKSAQTITNNTHLPFPDEKKLRAAEVKILTKIRSEWRYTDKSALEIFANLQHYHFPTRLLDVSKNALIALYFAVEDENITEDSRVFCFSVDDRKISLEEDKWNNKIIPWLEFNDSSDQPWCTQLPLYWEPPIYNPRITAQQAGFILAGVPKTNAKVGSKYSKGPGTRNKFWKIDEVKGVTSVPLRMLSLDSKSTRTNEMTFTFRISAQVKLEIKQKLEKMFNIKTATIYPDDFGAAHQTSKMLDNLIN